MAACDQYSRRIAARGRGKEVTVWQAMRGGDGCGASALDLVHAGNDMQPGKPRRRSGRRGNSATLPQSNSHRIDSTLVRTADGHNCYGISANGAASSSTVDQEGEDGVMAPMRSSDGVGASASGKTCLKCNRNLLEPGRPPRRSGRNEIAACASSSGHSGDVHKSGRGGEVPVLNGISVSGSTSSSMRSEHAGRGVQSHVAGVGASDRSVMRVRRRTSNRLAEFNVRITVNTSFNNSLTVHNQGRYRRRMGEAKSGDDDGQEWSPPVDRVGEYFPRIHDELGLQCLTRLPRYKIYRMALVCKKWKEYLMSAELYKARLDLGVREDWVFILGTNADKRWRAFLPIVGDWVALPPCPSDYTFDSCDKESMVAGLNLLVLGQDVDGYVIWKFDTIKSTWSTTPRMHVDRCMFGSATWGKYAYFAGGSGRGTVLKSVERYNSETNSWELLAEMNHDRKACSGFVMDDKFYVIGGQVLNNILSSGEAYDPQAGTWTVIEGMWPQEFVPSTQVSPPLVAVLKNQLYAINITQNMLMLYDKQHNAWKLLEKVPFRAENNNGWGLGFKAVGDELFVIGGPRGPDHFLPKIHAYRPRVDGGETWRLVTDLKIPTNGFIYNCAVMSG